MGRESAGRTVSDGRVVLTTECRQWRGIGASGGLARQVFGDRGVARLLPVKGSWQARRFAAAVIALVLVGACAGQTATTSPCSGARTATSIAEAAVPKNARNKESGFKYLNAMLEPAAQQVFASKMGYVPTVSDAPLDPALDRQINFSEAERARLWKPDFGYLATQQAAVFDFWNKDFKG